MQIYTFF